MCFLVHLIDSWNCILKSRFADYNKLSLAEKTQSDRRPSEGARFCCCPLASLTASDHPPPQGPVLRLLGVSALSRVLSLSFLSVSSLGAQTSSPVVIVLISYLLRKPNSVGPATILCWAPGAHMQWPVWPLSRCSYVQQWMHLPSQKPFRSWKTPYHFSLLFSAHIHCGRQYCYWFNTYTLVRAGAKSKPLFPDLQNRIC